MSLKCVCESILGVIEYSDLSTTKIKTIKKLCNKNIPKEIKFDENDLNICPLCRTHVRTDDKYCWNCGQRIFFGAHN